MEKKAQVPAAILQEFHYWFFLSCFLWISCIAILTLYTAYFYYACMAKPVEMAYTPTVVPAHVRLNPFATFMHLSDTLPDSIALRTLSFVKNKLECTGVTCNPDEWHAWFSNLEKNYSAKSNLSSFFETTKKGEYSFSLSLSF